MDRTIGDKLEDKVFDYAEAMVSTELYEGNRFAVGHPACHIFPLMLAVCGEDAIYTERFITVFAAAYEIAARWGASITFSNRILGHGTVMTAAAAVAYGLLTGVSEEELYEAVLIAGSLPCVSVWQSVFDGSRLHDCYSGLAGIIAIYSVKMAQRRVFSTEDMVAEVFGNIMGAVIRAEYLDKDLGKDFWINRNYFKIHTGCRFIHPFADVISRWMKEGLTEEDIDHIEIFTYKKAARLTAQTAVDDVEAKFSTPVSLAVMLHTGKLGHLSVRQYVTDETVRKLAKKISLHEDDAYNQLLPDVRGGRVVLFKNDGTCIREEVFHARGDFDDPDPFTVEDVIAKFRENAEGKMREEKQEEMIRSVLAS